MSDTDIKNRIVKAMRDAVNDGAQPPLTLDLTFENEMEMHLLSAEDVGPELARDILQKGVRKAFEDRDNTLFGMAINWKRPELKVNGS